MNNNIFKDVKFGDKFLTRAGKMAIFLYKNEGAMIFWIDGHNKESYYANYEGIWDNVFNIRSNYDIISRYQEPNGEEKLDKLAFEEYPPAYICNINQDYNEYLRDAFKAGYRKAKEE